MNSSKQVQTLALLFGVPLTVTLWPSSTPPDPRAGLVANLAFVEANGAAWHLTEPDIAIGPSFQMVVAIHHQNIGPQDLRYGYRKPEGPEWESTFTTGSIPFDLELPWSNDLFTNSIADPTVAYDASTGGFVCAALANLLRIPGQPLLQGSGIITSTWTESAGWSLWSVVDYAPAIPMVSIRTTDKPSIVAGESGEFYLTWLNTALHDTMEKKNTMGWARSIDSGLTWVTGVVEDELGDTVTSGYAPQPATAPNRPLYISHAIGLNIGDIRFLEGTDEVGGGMSFNRLFRSQFRPLKLEFERVPESAIAGKDIKCRHVPVIAVDDGNLDSFYFAFQERPMSTGTNADVFITRAHKEAGGYWGFDTRHGFSDPDPPDPVPPDPVDPETDQFLPIVDVDSNGDVHVIYYDDRRIDQLDNVVGPIYNIIYAVSTDAGASYTEFELDSGQNQPWLDLRLDPQHPGPREYVGLQVFESAAGPEVWVGALGTLDTTTEPTVIYGFEIK